MLVRRFVLLGLVALLWACAPSSPSPPTTSSTLQASSTSPTPTAVGPPTATPVPSGSAGAGASVQEFAVPAGSHPHDVAPAADGGVWYTAQATGKLGRLDPASGAVTEIPLGDGSAPHGVIVGPDGAPWITDAGLNAIVRVDPVTHAVKRFPLPPGTPNISLNTAAFGGDDTLWFTGQGGSIGTLHSNGSIDVQDAPRGRGPYGIAATPSGAVYFASLAGSYLGAADPETGGVADVFDPPTANAGPRRCWSDSHGRIWVSEWDVGQVGVFDPSDLSWREWKLPGDAPMAYAVYVDDHDVVWLTDFGADAIVRFDPVTETFTTVALPTRPAQIRQLLGRPGEVWGAESAADKLVVVRTGS